MQPSQLGRDSTGGYQPPDPHLHQPQHSPQRPEQRTGAGRGAAIVLAVVGIPGTWLSMIVIAILLGRFDDSVTILLAALVFLVGIGLLFVPNRAVKGLGLGLLCGGLTFAVFGVLTLRGG